MRVIATPKRNVQRARDDAIGGEHSLARQQPLVLDALDGRADVLWPQPEADIGTRVAEHSLETISHRSRPLSPPCPVAYCRSR